MHSSQLIAPAHRSFIRIVAGTSDTHRFFYRVTNTRSRNRHIFRKLIRDNSPREHLSLSLFTGKWRRQTILSIYRNTKKHTRDLTPRSTSAFLSARFPLFCAWPLLPRKKKRKKEKRSTKWANEKLNSSEREEVSLWHEGKRSSLSSTPIFDYSWLTPDPFFEYCRAFRHFTTEPSIYISKGSFLLNPFWSENTGGGGFSEEKEALGSIRIFVGC